MEQTQEAHTPDVIRLQDEDIRTGVNLIIAQARLQERMKAVEESAQAFVQQMAAKYGASQEYQLQDYLTGFVRVGD